MMRSRQERSSERDGERATERAREIDWVTRARAGDQAAFSELYAAYHPRVYAFVLRRVGEASEAEDLTQEAFVQLHRSLASWEGRSSLLTFSFGIAHHVCSHYFRHGSRWMIRPRDARPLEDHPSDAAIERHLDAAHALERFDAVLEASRRPAHREIFRLRYAESRSIRSIARHTGWSTDAVKVSLRRSRNALVDGVPELAQILDSAARRTRTPSAEATTPR